jgi:hypothetical protein
MVGNPEATFGGPVAMVYVNLDLACLSAPFGGGSK